MECQIRNIRKAYVEKRVEEITKRLRNLSLKDSAQTQSPKRDL